MIKWGKSDSFTHMLAVGPTRCGKTATLLKPMIYQLLLLKKRGVPLGLSVVEPKGDVARMVYEMCGEMGIPCIHVDPEKPDSHIFNPMEGEMDDVAEATVVVLKSLFGKQEAFFATVQELAARNVTKLLKRLQRDNINLGDVVRTMRDPVVMKDKVIQLKTRDGEDDLVQFFESELLGAQKEKYQQFVIGLRAQLENLTSNPHLSRIINGKSSINIDKHFAEGGILAVNTAMGKLRKAGDAFGQFVTMHLQNGTFRRPGTEDTRVPHFLIIDEYSRYINPDVELFLSIAAEYKVAGIFAIQSLGQLEVEAGKINARAMKQSIMTSCRSKITFGGLGGADATEFSDEFGKKIVVMRQSTYKQQILIPNILPETYRDTEKEESIIPYTELMFGLPRFHYVAKLMQDGTPQPPTIGRGSFVPKDWAEQRVWIPKDKQSKKWRIRWKTQEGEPLKAPLFIPASEETADPDPKEPEEEEGTPVSKLQFVDEEQPEQGAEKGEIPIPKGPSEAPLPEQANKTGSPQFPSAPSTPEDEDDWDAFE